ncbi:TonB family protein [Spirosoma utsteinense]|uniref:TonB family protein n=1 Tax=Spirosoma utsteinense TaxID=2585773 RepID=A0ABR6W4A0_9BACT|nr:TonB family protein [Spirosoma utsteinense]MBC3784239.1 TonB family protein [Spirosoma utsteinense]MBC3790963.1 TonB family protein [Spirosoma utsteinense]
MNALDYFLKANLYGLLFAGCYWLFLRRHTFLNLNRAYLLLSTVLTLSLPLISLPAQTIDSSPDWGIPVGVITLPAAGVVATPVDAGPTSTEPDWEQIGIWLYGLITALLLLRLAIQLSRVVRLIRRSDQDIHADYVLIRPRDHTTPTFSFFRYILLNPADSQNGLILQHELVHVRQHHSADVLGLALLKVLFWPVIGLIFVDRALRQVHEFLADRAASGSKTDYGTDYARLLVEYTFGVRPETLSNSFFNPSLLKQRILMLHQRATNRWALGKYMLVLPLVFVLLAMTTAREEIVAVVTQAGSETITVSGQVVGADGRPLPGATVIEKGTKRGTSTDVEGKFMLSNVPKNATLVISFIGFDSHVVKVNGKAVVNVTMARAIALREVVVETEELTPGTTKPTSTTSPNRKGEVFTVVEQAPEFPGGMDELEVYLTKNLRYPADARKANVKGRVFVQFVVTETGTIESLRILRGIGFGCDEEAVRVVSRMPNWTPGKQNGKPVSVQYNLPILFDLVKKEDKRTGHTEPVFAPTGSPIGDFGLTNHPPMPTYPLSDNPTIRVRGNGAFGELVVVPLYIVDGVVSSADTLSSIDPKTIESVHVIKDASATAPYGDKAKNGAVIITTKKL